MTIGASRFLSQSLAQLLSRAFLYGSFLVILPSYVTISAEATYANMVLLITLLSVANQFDGGYGAALVNASVLHIKDGSRLKLLLQDAMIGTMRWSIAISLALVLLWQLVDADGSDRLTSTDVLTLLALCVLCAEANVINRMLFARDFNIESMIFLILGPVLGFSLLLVLRIFEVDEIVLIACVLAFGYLVTFSAVFYKQWVGFTEFPFRRLFDFRGNSFANESGRLWFFGSQIISILVVAKNSYMVKYFGGIADLKLFSLYTAIFSAGIAPVAALQMPLMVKMRQDFLREKNVSLLKWALIVCALAVSVLACIFLLIQIPFVNNRVQLLSNIGYDAGVIIFLSVQIAAFCVGYALFLMVSGHAGLLLVSGICVLLVDTVVISIYYKNFGSLTTVFSIMVSNVISLIVVHSLVLLSKVGLVKK